MLFYYSFPLSILTLASILTYLNSSLPPSVRITLVELAHHKRLYSNRFSCRSYLLIVWQQVMVTASTEVSFTQICQHQLPTPGHSRPTVAPLSNVFLKLCPGDATNTVDLTVPRLRVSLVPPAGLRTREVWPKTRKALSRSTTGRFS